MARFERLKVKPGTPSMEAKLVDALPDGPGWRYEPKWDGFRCLVFRDGADIELQSKSGKPLGRYFPEVVAAMAGLDADLFAIDGELIIPVGEALSFEALQMRLHRLGPPGALPVKPGGATIASRRFVNLAFSPAGMAEVKPTWSSSPASL